MKKINCAILTREDMIGDLLPILSGAIKDQVDAYLKDDTYHSVRPNEVIDPTLHGILSGVPERDKDLIIFWRNCCTTMFFHDHEDINEVVFAAPNVDENTDNQYVSVAIRGVK